MSEVTKDLYHYEEEEIVNLLVGRKVEYVKDGMMILDDGSRLDIIPNEGCGGCSSGWFGLTELNAVDNVITSAEISLEEGEDGYTEVYSIFVYAENKKILLAEVAGDLGNGYYGSGFRIQAVLAANN